MGTVGCGDGWVWGLHMCEALLCSARMWIFDDGDIRGDSPDDAERRPAE